MSIGHNHPPADEPSIEETIRVVCRSIDVAAILFWLAYATLTATW